MRSYHVDATASTSFPGAELLYITASADTYKFPRLRLTEEELAWCKHYVNEENEPDQNYLDALGKYYD